MLNGAAAALGPDLNRTDTFNVLFGKIMNDIGVEIFPANEKKAGSGAVCGFACKPNQIFYKPTIHFDIVEAGQSTRQPEAGTKESARLSRAQ